MHIGMDIDQSDQDNAMDVAEKANDNLDGMAYSQHHETSTAFLQNRTEYHMGLANVPSGPRAQLQQQLPQNVPNGPGQNLDNQKREVPFATRRDPARRHSDTSIDTRLQSHPQTGPTRDETKRLVLPPRVPKKRKRSLPTITRERRKGSKGPAAKDAKVMRDILATEIEERKSKAAARLNKVLARAQSLKSQAISVGGESYKEKVGRGKARCALKLISREERMLKATLADPQGLFPFERRRKQRIENEKMISDLGGLSL
ncbi:hypothetical protein BJ875DRAFT_542136 [Amylocarpus encephaloides]|uniref:Uncharacterized protein n=1 Tax=Amylocarpus encephaloides TaxID=45428 RepID=A0A9P7YKB2_9HELO|nr:hypothetical protein BJ875DRAFT_542136 [Amylocarpus encephaloides]